MAKRRMLSRDTKRLAEIRALLHSVGIFAGGGYWGDHTGFVAWQESTHPKRSFAERTYAALLFTGELDLAISIAERTTGIHEAGREANAVAALKEIAGA